MQLSHTKAAIGSVWVLAVLVAAFAVGVASRSGWIVLAAFAFLPPIVMWRLWNAPPQSISESIQEARR
jgi:hypothetical protein